MTLHGEECSTDTDPRVYCGASLPNGRFRSFRSWKVEHHERAGPVFRHRELKGLILSELVFRGDVALQLCKVPRGLQSLVPSVSPSCPSRPLNRTARWDAGKIDLDEIYDRYDYLREKRAAPF
jgi:hypothetical protein